MQQQQQQNDGPARDHVLKQQVRYQTLVDGQFNEGKLFKLKHGWVLRLQLSSELVHKTSSLRVFCNIPNNASQQQQKFVRTTFYEYPWVLPPGSIKHDEFNRYVDIKCHLAGSFRYYFIYADESTGKNHLSSIQSII